MPPSMAEKKFVALVTPDLIVHHDKAHNDADGATDREISLMGGLLCTA